MGKKVRVLSIPAIRDRVVKVATTVSGLTMTRASVQRVQTFRRAVQNNRSRAVKGGRGRLRLSTATCCRRARISRAVSTRHSKNTRTAARMF